MLLVERAVVDQHHGGPFVGCLEMEWHWGETTPGALRLSSNAETTPRSFTVRIPPSVVYAIETFAPSGIHRNCPCQGD